MRAKGDLDKGYPVCCTIKIKGKKLKRKNKKIIFLKKIEKNKIKKLKKGEPF
jgi:hypothetical protein